MEMMGKDKRTFAGIVFEYFFAIGQLVIMILVFLSFKSNIYRYF